MRTQMGKDTFGYSEAVKVMAGYSRELERQYRALAASGFLEEIEQRQRALADSGVFHRVVAGAEEAGRMQQQMLDSVGGGQLKLLLEEQADLLAPSRELLAAANFKTIAGAASAIDPSWYSGVISAAKQASGVVVARLAGELSVAKGIEAGLLSAYQVAQLPDASSLVDFAGWESLRRGLDGMLLAQGTLLKSFSEQGVGALAVPRVVMDWPPLGILTHAGVVRALGAHAPAHADRPQADAAHEERCERLAEETNRKLTEVLADRRALREEWDAAQDVLRSKNPRRGPYFCLSVRRLLTWILDEVAPLRIVAAWGEANDSKESAVARSRFRYVASMFPNEHFASYVVKDSEEMFRVWDLVNSRLHGDSPPTEAALKALERRAAVWMLGVLTLTKGRMN